MEVLKDVIQRFLDSQGISNGFEVCRDSAAKVSHAGPVFPEHHGIEVQGVTELLLQCDRETGSPVVSEFQIRKRCSANTQSLRYLLGAGVSKLSGRSHVLADPFRLFHVQKIGQRKTVATRSSTPSDRGTKYVRLRMKNAPVCNMHVNTCANMHKYGVKRGVCIDSEGVIEIAFTEHSLKRGRSLQNRQDHRGGRDRLAKCCRPIMPIQLQLYIALVVHVSKGDGPVIKPEMGSIGRASGRWVSYSHLSLFVWAIVGILLSASAGQAVQKLVWLEIDGTFGGVSQRSTIWMSDLDGANSTLLVDEQTGITDFVVDAEGEFLYWANGSVWRQDINGGTADLLTSPIGASFLALTTTGDSLFVTSETSPGRLAVLSLSSLTLSVMLDDANLIRYPKFLGIDDGARRLYFRSNLPDNTDYLIRSVGFAGDDVTDVVPGQFDLGVEGIAVHGGELYWAGRDAGKIYTSGIDGSGVHEIVSGLTDPRGVSLDIVNGRIYWCDLGSGGIYSAGLDGSNIETVITSQLNPHSVSVISLGNSPPLLAAIGDQAATVGETLTVVLSATDNDEDPLSFSMSGGPVGSTLTNGVFVWSPTVVQIGSHAVTFTADDGRGGADSEEVTISVNGPPVLAEIGPQAATIGVVFTLGLSATDVDGDPLSFDVTDAPAGATLTGSAFEWTPAADQAGDHDLTFTVDDGRGGTDTEEVTISVNTPPVLAEIGPQAATTGVVFTLGLSATDVDGDPLAFAASSSDANVVTAIAIGSDLVITPEAMGTATITVSANDSRGGVASIDLAITVGEALRLTVAGPNNDCGADPPFDCTMLIAGFAIGATDGLDLEMGERELPPLPPNADIFDVRLAIPGIEGLLADLRDPLTTNPEWQITIRAGLGGYPITLSWNRQSLPAGAWRLRSLDAAQGIDVDLTNADSFIIADPLVSELVITGSRTVVLHYPSGWNIASIPVLPTDGSLGVLFPDALGAFGFSGGYQQATTLVPCEGYWLNLASGGSYTITGEAVDQCDRPLPARWSIQGVPVGGTRVADIVEDPPGNLLSVYAFEGTYVLRWYQDLLAEGRGFWFNMAGAGQVTLNSDTGGVARRVPMSSEVFSGPVLWAQSGDQRLAIQLGIEDDLMMALPPLPPAGLLDVRVRVGDIESWQVPRSDEPTDYALMAQGIDVQLSWDVPASEGGRWELVIGDQRVSLSDHGFLDLGERTTASAQLILRQLGGLPRSYSLSHNFPNPFNPATTIRYELKHNGPVSLMVYDITGQLVRSLVAGEQPAGRYTITWDGRNTAGTQAASGVYLCELRAGSFRSVQKMLLMK
jgi:hypothetical protein